MLHKQLGAFLIAVGQQMIIRNIGLQAVLDDVTLDDAIKASLVDHGVDAASALHIAQHQGFNMLNDLALETFASVEAEAARTTVDQDDEVPDDDSDDDVFAFTRSEAVEAVQQHIVENFGDGALTRAQTYLLTLGEIAGDIDLVADVWDQIAEELDVRADIPTAGLENYTISQIAQWMVDNQRK